MDREELEHVPSQARPGVPGLSKSRSRSRQQSPNRAIVGNERAGLSRVVNGLDCDGVGAVLRTSGRSVLCVDEEEEEQRFRKNAGDGALFVHCLMACLASAATVCVQELRCSQVAEESFEMLVCKIHGRCRALLRRQSQLAPAAHHIATAWAGGG